MNNFLFTICGILLLNSCEIDSIAPSSLKDQIEEIVQPSLFYGTHTGVAVGVYNSGEKSTFLYGFSNNETASKTTEKTLFEIGSITKTFTATLIKQLENEGFLNIDDPIENYLPKDVSVPEYQAQKITFRHILSHTASLPREARNEETSNHPFDYHDFKNEEFNHFLNYYHSLSYPPATYFSYSNAGFGLLGYIMERVAGKSYGELLEEKITNPLQMPDTRVPSRFTTEQRGRRAISYDTNQEVLPFSAFGEHQGSGAIFSTLDDMMKYLEANLEPLSDLRQVFDVCHTLVFTNDRYNFSAEMPHMGLGWRIFIEDGDTITGHTGITNQTSYMRFIKEKQVGVVVLTNTFNAQRTFEIGNEILNLLR